MKIGLVPTLNPSFGGSYQYALAMLDSAIKLSRENHDANTFVLFVRPEDSRILRSLETIRGIQIVPYGSLSDKLFAWAKAWVGQGVIRETLRKLRQQATRKRLRGPEQMRRGTELGKWLRQHKIDWVLYTASDSISFESGVPYVMPVFDLQHRLQPEFPEVSAGGEWDEREYLYRNGTCNATLILADSEVGKEDILEFYAPYGVTPDRVKVLPFLPAPYLSTDVSLGESMRVCKLYGLSERFLFYPAQLWPHKNHVRIVQAIGLLKEEKAVEVHVVFCGTYSGEIREQVFQEVMSEAHRLRIAHQIHYLGYVPNETMSVLYAEALGLVMPTFFGPTNIPILEAWLFGCPVLTSDIRGIREQVGDAGLLVDPHSVEAIADGMRRLWEDDVLRSELAQRGTQRLATYSTQDFCAKLAEIIEEANLRVAEQRSGGRSHFPKSV